MKTANPNIEKVTYHEATNMDFNLSYKMAQKLTMKQVCQLVDEFEQVQDVSLVVGVLRHKALYYGNAKTSVLKAVENKIKKLTLQKPSDETLYIIKSLVPFSSYRTRTFGFVDNEEKRFFFSKSEYNSWNRVKKLMEKRSKEAN